MHVPPGRTANRQDVFGWHRQHHRIEDVDGGGGCGGSVGVHEPTASPSMLAPAPPPPLPPATTSPASSSTAASIPTTALATAAAAAHGRPPCTAIGPSDLLESRHARVADELIGRGKVVPHHAATSKWHGIVTASTLSNEGSISDCRRTRRERALQHACLQGRMQRSFSSSRATARGELSANVCALLALCCCCCVPCCAHPPAWPPGHFQDDDLALRCRLFE